MRLSQSGPPLGLGGTPYCKTRYFLDFQKIPPKIAHFGPHFDHFHTTVMSGMQGQGGFQPVRVTSCSRS